MGGTMCPRGLGRGGRARGGFERQERADEWGTSKVAASLTNLPRQCRAAFEYRFPRNLAAVGR